MKKPGTPKVAINAALVSLKTERPRSPLASGRHGTGADTISQNSLQAIDALVGLVAGDDRGVDRADRDAGDPFRLEIEMTQRLIGAGLVGAERTATLEHQHALGFGRRRRRRWQGMMGHGLSSTNQKAMTTWRHFTMASIGHQCVSVDARMSVQNTLYLVFGA